MNEPITNAVFEEDFSFAENLPHRPSIFHQNQQKQHDEYFNEERLFTWSSSGEAIQNGASAEILESPSPTLAKLGACKRIVEEINYTINQTQRIKALKSFHQMMVCCRCTEQLIMNQHDHQIFRNQSNNQDFMNHNEPHLGEPQEYICCPHGKNYYRSFLPAESNALKGHDLYDTFMKVGAAESLCLKLGYILNQSHSTRQSLSSVLFLHNAHNISDANMCFEIHLLCLNLHVLYSRSSNEMSIKSFRDIGAELLPLLLLTMKAHFKNVNPTIATSENEIDASRSDAGEPFGTKTDYFILRAVLGVLRTFSMIDDKVIKIQLLSTNKSFLFDIILHILSLKQLPTTKGSEGKFVALAECKREALRILKNLTYRIHTLEYRPNRDVIVRLSAVNRRKLLEVLSCLISGEILAQIHMYHEQERGVKLNIEAIKSKDVKSEVEQHECFVQDKPIVKMMEYATATIWNLAIRPERSKIPSILTNAINGTHQHERCTERDVLIQTEMAQHTLLINALIKILTNSDLEITSKKSQRNAASAIGNLASVAANRLVLLSHQNSSLLTALIRTIIWGNDPGMMRRSIRTIRCLTSGYGNGRAILARHTNILVDLMKVSLLPKKEVETDTRKMAMEALELILEDIHYTAPSEQFKESETSATNILHNSSGRGCLLKNVVGLLDAANTLNNDLKQTNQQLFESLTKTLLLISSLSEKERACMVETTGLLDTITRVAMDDSSSISSREHVVQILANFAGDDSSLEKMADNPSVLNCLAATSSLLEALHDRTKIISVAAIVRLSSLESNIGMMSEHEGIITSLVNFVLSAPDSTIRNMAKDSIMKLVYAL